MTTVTKHFSTNELAAFRAVVWMETLALSVLLWMAIIKVVARFASL
jgi:hypothetical protein